MNEVEKARVEMGRAAARRAAVRARRWRDIFGVNWVFNWCFCVRALNGTMSGSGEVEIEVTELDASGANCHVISKKLLIHVRGSRLELIHEL